MTDDGQVIRLPLSQRILVVGSYPPVRTAGAPATLAAVRRAIDAGDDPVVASPRSSAAHYYVPVSGPFAGRRLNNLRELTGATRLVLCAERDLPVPTSFAVPSLLAVLQRRTVDEVVAAAGRFDSVTLIIGGDLGVAAPLEDALRAMADEVIDARSGGPGQAGVTVLGPDERTPTEQLTDLTRKVGRRALGPLAPTVRRAGVEVLHRVRKRA